MRRIPVAAVLALLVLLAGCAGATGGTEGTGEAVSRPTPVPGGPGRLVLQVEHVGGFVTPEMLAARLPVVSVYSDGRVITQGPQIAIYPAPALPNLQVQQIPPEAVQELIERALAAGVGEDLDLGRPPIADATSTRFSVVTAEGTEVLEVYALGSTLPVREPAPAPGTEPAPDPGPGPADGLTPEQQAVRAELQELVELLSSPAQLLGPEAVSDAEPYVPEAVAALVTEWTEPEGEVAASPEVAWPGPPLPGEPLAEGLGLFCVTARGEAAEAVLEAAESATMLTPWVSEDGQRWSVTLRPLLPHESGCADLLEE
ncbi:hypothetical protein E4P41_05245 [Geodermatophilus sp. DF01-2]|uniref:hypothetical protein n=1 Tax=Geodermatophilus sp. DF01-2 TaxID=2559610 RepID=UPI001073FEB1|nr:hypothetical protein [Geodermatophilus sp. DF01_2]TFV63262.1 hypothetical protein E4P41_05245 [Geodermatophilus sp. DF01_2]